MDFDPPGSAMGGDSNPTFGHAEPSEQNGNAVQQEYAQQANAAQEPELYSPGPSLDYSPLPNQDPGETCGVAMTWWTQWLVRICLYVDGGVSACCYSSSLPFNIIAMLLMPLCCQFALHTLCFLFLAYVRVEWVKHCFAMRVDLLLKLYL